MTSQEAWMEAQKIVPDLGAAKGFLQSRELIPEGESAMLGESLITGLLHLAFTATGDLTKRGILAFAHLAKGILDYDSQTAVSDAVVERAEGQLRLRLDYHTSHVEDRLDEFSETIKKMKAEMEEGSASLREACERVRGAEEALSEARDGMQVATRLAASPGEPAAAAPTLTIDTAPTRVRRAATLADLLQRQVLVRGATLNSESGEALGEEALRDRAREVLDELDRGGLSPPRDCKIEAAKILPHSDTVFTMSSIEAARWLLKPTVAKPFARKMGMAAQVVERTYRLVAERVPVTFDPRDSVALRAIETAHLLKPNSIVRAEWIKPAERRFAGQRTAFLMLTVTGVDQANTALKGLLIAGRRILVRRDMDEPKRCARCQEYGGHFARDCKAAHDVCANCADSHPTSQCGVAGDPYRYRCANCKEDGHAAWDRACPSLRTRVSAHIHRKADSGFRFFVTNAPDTWVSEEEELARAPPPPTVWSQVRHRFDRADEEHQRTQQSTLDGFLRTPGQSANPAPRQ
ncbi:hypothetical protein VTO73DRAFT_12193 [Trametes versicolor]